MRAEELTKEAEVSRKRAFAISCSSASLALFGGLAAFFVVAGNFKPSGGEEAIVDQDFFLIVVNLIPLVAIIAALSFAALLFQAPLRAVSVAMTALLVLVAGGLAYLFFRYSDPSSKQDQAYLVAALVPAMAAILVNWLSIILRVKRRINMDKVGKLA
ncbi:hypothetical protein [Rhizobium sp. NFACC06-2]|uniref:hypothetical protein n=1 Tax=Rhizobium sp. NFACC06-2 TaxID=1566264 RepID=UPI000877492B|nr:hypothetical protein [Rhizobium sp. NFACC06-2]SCX99217.1 hypothetical protein SAMN03159288_00888 [Rhizobium sp. NFACC06-2]